MDLRPRSDGAINFGSWLRHKADHQRLTGLHVIERPREPTLGVFNGDALMSQAKFGAERVLDEHHARSDFDDVGVEFGDAAEAYLQASLLARDADGLLIGRRAASDDRSFIRLGRVARRLLRQLPVPTIVVPPELEAKDVGAGPVIALTDLQSDSVAAIRFAERMAGWLRRPLVLSYTVSLLDHLVVYLPSDSYKSVEGTVTEAAAIEMKQWAEQNEFGGLETVVTKGSIMAETGLLAQERDACLLVCGSRGFSAVERLFITSVGSELAAVSRVPVAVVPSDWPGVPD
jgi:nucleotide-binding universal stress UspA family protein